MTNTILLPFRPDSMTPGQLAAVSYLARYSGHTHRLYAYQLRRWFGWCEAYLLGIMRTRGPPSTTTAPEAISTATASNSSPPTSQGV